MNHLLSPERATYARKGLAYRIERPFRASGLGLEFPGRCPGLI